MWHLWSLLLDDRVRLSRLIAIPSALLALLIFVYGMVAPDSFWIGSGLAILFAGFAVGVWSSATGGSFGRRYERHRKGCPIGSVGLKW
jgi:hypothetical protein